MTADRAQRTPAGARWAALVPAAASFAVATTVAGVLAVHLAVRADELFTLRHVHDAGLSDLWQTYQADRDTLPPAGYVASWTSAQVLGSSLLAVRAPVVAAWGVAAAGISLATRRAGGWAAFVAGLVPSATSLVFLGALARPYALPLACLSIGLVCWQRAGEVERGRPWLVGAFVLFAAAVASHYLAAPVPLVLGAVAWWSQPGRGRPGPRSVVPVAAVGAVAAASAALVPRAIEDQGRIASSVGVRDLVGFWPSALEPAVAALLLGVVVVVVALVRGRGAPGSRPGPVLDAELRRAGWGIVVVVPVVAWVAMAATSGVYVHRYAVGAVIGGGVLVAEAVGRTVRRQRSAGAVLAVLALLAVALAGHAAADQAVSADRARALAGDLRLDVPGSARIVVVDPYDLALVRTTDDEAVRGRLRLGRPGPVVGAEVVDVDDVLAAGGGPVHLVVDERELDRLLHAHPRWSAVVLAEASYARPEVPRHLIHVRLERA